MYDAVSPTPLLASLNHQSRVQGDLEADLNPSNPMTEAACCSSNRRLICPRLVHTVCTHNMVESQQQMSII